MLTDTQISVIARETLQRMQRAFDGEPFVMHSYRCQNEVQDFDRLAFHTAFEDRLFEVQINCIRHASGWHHHNSDMTSVMLLRGYRWHLRQSGWSESVEFYAAPGSIIRMRPTDWHMIPPLKEPAISLCVFEDQTWWHQHYPTLPFVQMGCLIGAALDPIKEIVACGS